MSLYSFSIENTEEFWSHQAKKFITWHTEWQKVLTGDFEHLDELAWFRGAKLNACYNCIDRHVKTDP